MKNNRGSRLHNKEKTWDLNSGSRPACAWLDAQGVRHTVDEIDD